MEVILLDHIEKVGGKHDVVKVKDGFGRNYLIPQGLALVANKSNMARLDGMKKQASKKDAALVAELQAMVSKIAGKTLKIAAKAGESGRLFGSVTAQHLISALEAEGVKADKRIVEMPEEVKELGEYKATLKFHPQVITEVSFEVVPEGN